MIALALTVLLAAIPMEAKPFPPRSVPAFVSMYVNHPSVLQQTNVTARGGLLPMRVTIYNGQVVTPIEMWATFLDSCGAIGYSAGCVLTLEPYQGVVCHTPFQIPPTACVGWGYMEFVMMSRGELTVMDWDACKLIGAPAQCRARISVPVYVQP